MHYYVDTCHQKAARDQNRHHAPSSCRIIHPFPHRTGCLKGEELFRGKQKNNVARQLSFFFYEGTMIAMKSTYLHSLGHDKAVFTLSISTFNSTLLPTNIGSCDFRTNKPSCIINLDDGIVFQR